MGEADAKGGQVGRAAFRWTQRESERWACHSVEDFASSAEVGQVQSLAIELKLMFCA